MGNIRDIERIPLCSATFNLQEYIQYIISAMIIRHHLRNHVHSIQVCASQYKKCARHIIAKFHRICDPISQPPSNDRLRLPVLPNFSRPGHHIGILVAHLGRRLLLCHVGLRVGVKLCCGCGGVATGTDSTEFCASSLNIVIVATDAPA
jgi:hypothetical protein